MNTTTLKALLGTALVGATTVVGAFYSRQDAGFNVTAEPVSRGDIVSVVAATGTLEAMTTVQVGSQVSGTIASLHADFNDIVRKGHVLARLDPSLYRSAIEQANANLLGAQAAAERIAVVLHDEKTKLRRARELSAKQLISTVDLEIADVAVRSAEAQLKAAAAQVSQASASVRQAQVSLSKTIIASPIDGIVIARNVAVGQTVAASLSAPTLYVLAADLANMQLKTNIDEADLGRITANQPAEFTVDAYPGETFTGTVKEVRLNPVIESNVVTYAAIVTAPNRDLKLKPGMTANVIVVVARRNDVLRVASAALRYAPPAGVLQMLNADASTPSKGPNVWQYLEGRLRWVSVTPGATDGRYTEILDDALPEGARVVTAITDGDPRRRAAAPR